MYGRHFQRVFVFVALAGSQRLVVCRGGLFPWEQGAGGNAQGHFRECEKRYALPFGSRCGYSPKSLGDWPVATFQANLAEIQEVHQMPTIAQLLVTVSCEKRITKS